MHPYVQAVLDSSPQNYWPYGSDGDPLAGASVITTHGATFGVPGPLLHGDLGATSFDGGANFAQVPLDLSTLGLFTVELFLLWDTSGTDDDFLMEQSATANSNPGFNFDWNASGGVSLKINWGAGEARWVFARPTDDVFHHLMAVIAANGTIVPEVFIDGAAVVVTEGDAPSQNSGTFTADTLNLMCRDGSALFGAGDMAHLAFYPADVSADLPAHIAAITAEEEPEPPEPGKFKDARLGWGLTPGNYMINKGAL